MKLTIHEITEKLIGPILPVGETNADKNRLENLEKSIDLVERILLKIASAAISADRHEASMKAIGVKARQFLDNLKGSDF